MSVSTVSILLAAAAALQSSDTIAVSGFDFYGPYPVTMPLMVDSVDVHSKAYDPVSVLSAGIEKHAVRPSGIHIPAGELPASNTPAVNMLAFTVDNTIYATPLLNVSGLKDYKITVDGSAVEPGSQLKLSPSSHRVVIKYLSQPDVSDTVSVSLTGASGLSVRTDGNRLFSLDDVLHGQRIYQAPVSPDGKWMITIISNTIKGGNTSWLWSVVDTSTGQTLLTTTEAISWMPQSSLYYLTRYDVDGRSLIAVDPATGNEKVLAKSLPEGSFIVSPDEKSLIFLIREEGPKEDPSVYQVLEPEDRQPGWRNRTRLAKYDMSTGILQPLTHGYHNISLLDISPDGNRLLMSVSKSRLEKRPTTLFSIIDLDMTTMKTDTIVSEDGFVSTAVYSPDGNAILVCGSPEAFGGIGNVVPEGRHPSMVDNQLFLCSADGTVKPLTRDFDPSVQSFVWNKADGKIWFNAENRDYISLYRLDPVTGKITQVSVPEDLVNGFSLPKNGTTGSFWGQSASNSSRLYTIDTRKLRSTLISEPQGEMLADVELGICEPWNFINSRGDSIYGRFYLPPSFDPSRKYPLIVNYYGGCSPTSRNFATRYPHHAYAAQDYVVYVIEPSGATGFGQEFSSRHVNTAGQGVAEDIIEGTKQFCREHAYVDSTKIGCIGASYGGFMTQYLQTVTPMFAAAISHAGISDHTSYWGEGYWGYSYSEVSMADSYPWSDIDLYVKQSPLYRADRIHTPLLFLHGDADKNVPVGESIQMFTALKLLGRPTAFVAVADQDHHILDYDKRRKWQDTIFAWFARYLKDDPTWWNELYPPKSL